MQEMDILLKEAFGELIEQEYQQRPRNLPKHRFSMRFRIKMYRLLRQVGAKSKRLDGGSSMLELYRPVRSKRGLVIILALLLMLLGGTITAAETLVQWLNEIMLEQHGDHVKIRRMGTEISEGKMIGATEDVFPKYELSQVPKTYRLIEKRFYEEIQEYKIVYKDTRDNILFFRQSGESKDAIGNITSAKTEMEKVIVNEFVGYYVKDYDTASLVLFDEKYLIELSGSLTKEELILLAEKLQFVE